jgi:predicted TPR repeat methyltransferase
VQAEESQAGWPPSVAPLELQPASAEYQTNIAGHCSTWGIGASRRKICTGPDASLNRSIQSLAAASTTGHEMTAVYHWLAFEPGNPIPQHMVAAGSRAVPERAADQYVADLFDGFAESFESTLLSLGYQTPQVLSALIQAELGDDTTPLRILDAGCGTGLAAPLLKPLASQLVGVDLSPKMIDKARERSLYDELVVAELCAFMGRPAA